MRHDDDGGLPEIDGDVVVGGDFQESQQAFVGTVRRSVGQKGRRVGVVVGLEGLKELKTAQERDQRGAEAATASSFRFPFDRLVPETQHEQDELKELA